MSFGDRLSLHYRAWRYRLKVEAPEIAYVLRVLRPGDTALDIGAHKGAFTYWMRRAVGAGGRVISFEPQPELALRLERLAGELGWSNVTVEARALSSGEGTAALHVPRGGPGPGASLEAAIADPEGERIDVPLTSLDAYFSGKSVTRLALIKCDVEGHELDVFRGAARLLAEHRPALLFECEARHHKHDRIERVFEHLEGLGYRGRFFLGGVLRPVSELRIEEHQVPGKVPYANNFVFEAVPPVV